MEPKTLEIFFTGKAFTWGLENVNELFEDIQESIETGTAHYIGTFILSKKGEEDRFRIVDGQQRLTTLMMLINSFLKNLGKEYEKTKIIYDHLFLRTDNGLKLNILGDNETFFRELLNDNNPSPQNRSQKLLSSAYNHINNRVTGLHELGYHVFLSWLNSIKSLQILEFIEPDEGKAIRIFLTVNDRGIELTNMEKAKSLLISYSNRLLNGKLDQAINAAFGIAFQAYDSIKEIAEDINYNVQLINQQNFTEDSIMRYHFLSFNNEFYDYNATIKYVLDIFLKSTLKRYRDDSKKLEEFIEKYIEDLQLFFEELLSLLNGMKLDKRYYKLFSILNLSTFLYPLTIRLKARGLLDQAIPNNPNLTFLDLIENVDVRVYKIYRGTAGKDISILARDAAIASPEEISSRLLAFIKYFAGDAVFRSNLEQDIYKNPALNHILFEYNEELLGKSGYDLQSLVRLNLESPTVEHIFPEEPTFDFPSRGFESEENYLAKIHKLGNLTLLEKWLNSRCWNKTVEEKVREPDLYMRSNFKITQKLLSDIQNKGGSFTSTDIDNRTKILVDFCLRRWPLWG